MKKRRSYYSKTEAKSGTDFDLKSFAANTLPTLKMHLQMIEAAK